MRESPLSLLSSSVVQVYCLRLDAKTEAIHT